MRDGWVETTLGEVARNRPPAGVAAPGIPYVALEHFDSGDPALHRWGDTADATSATTPFEPGDVLFGKLRPYLRKVVVADFSGRCTNEALAYRVSSPALSQEYLALLLRSDAALSHASVTTGTRMPRTSARSMASMRVLLPSIEEQRRIVDLMSHVDATLAADRSETHALAKCAASLRADTFSHPEGPRPVGDVYQVTTGKQLQSSNTTGECFEYVRAGNIGEEGVLDLAVMKSMYFSSQEIDRLALRAGDVLIVEGGNGFGKSAIWPGSEQVTGYQNHVLRVRSTSEQYPPELAYQWSRWCHENGVFKPTGTGIPSLGLRRVKAMPIPGNSPQLLENVRTLTTIEQALDVRRQAAEQSEQLRSAFLAALVRGGHSIPVSYDEFIRDEGAA